MRVQYKRRGSLHESFVHLRYIWLKKIGQSDVPHSTLPECGTGGHAAAH